MGKLTILAVCVYALAVVACPATATLYLLEDRNSSAVIDDGSEEGMSSWIVDGTENLFQQWFWYRIGDQVDESSLDTLGAPTGVVHSNPTPIWTPGRNIWCCSTLGRASSLVLLLT